MAVELQGVINELLEGSIKTIGKKPVINELNVIENGIYAPPSGVDGFAPVNVNIPKPILESLNVTENGTYTPSSIIDGFNEVVVNVPSLTIDYLKNNSLIYDTNDTKRFAYDNNKTLTEGWYIASLSWYDYNQDKTVNTMFYYSGSGELQIFGISNGYNYWFDIFVNPTYTRFQLSSGVAFNCYCKLSKVFNSQIYS